MWAKLNAHMLVTFVCPVKGGMQPFINALTGQNQAMETALLLVPGMSQALEKQNSGSYISHDAIAYHCFLYYLLQKTKPADFKASSQLETS